MTASDREPTVVDVIKQDHREVEELRVVADHVIAELVRHSVAEEEHLYPAFREHLDDGDELADHEIEEHAEAERKMKEIESLDADHPRLRPAFDTLVAEITHHVQEEEEDDALPRLEAACSHEELVELGRKVQRAKRLAPTRPHPSAPDRPPANKLLAPGAGLVDRVRDALSGRDV